MSKEINKKTTESFELHKFLLLGSASYIKDWYKKYGQILIQSGYKLCALNNAWAIDPANVYLWLYPSDFFESGHLFPDKEQRKRWNEHVCDHRQPFEGKYDYVKAGSGTMLLNALVYLLNKSLADSCRCEVLVSGSDCIYKNKNHFYGKGASDPLRYGKQWLINELARIKTFYEKEYCEIYNVGNRRKTLLPFKRKKIKLR